MAKEAAGADVKPDVELLVDETDSADFDTDERPPSTRPASSRDPALRRKIEDRLERIRLREELGIYDDGDLSDL